MTQEKMYFIEETQTTHSYEFLKERKDDPKWRPAYERVSLIRAKEYELLKQRRAVEYAKYRKKKIIKWVVFIVVSAVLILVGLATLGVLKGSEKEPILSLTEKTSPSKQVDTTKLTEEQVIEWVTAIINKRNSTEFAYNNYELRVNLADNNLVYIEVISRDKQAELVFDLFRISEAGHLEESGQYLEGVDNNDWRIISENYLDVSLVNGFIYSNKNKTEAELEADLKKKTEAQNKAYLDGYNELDMRVKVLLAMSLATTSSDDSTGVFEDFKLSSNGEAINDYQYELIEEDLLVVYQSSRKNEIISYELYFDTTGKTVIPLRYVEVVKERASDQERFVRSEQKALAQNKTDKAVLYKHYLENVELYNQLANTVNRDGSFLARDASEELEADN